MVSLLVRIKSVCAIVILLLLAPAACERIDASSRAPVGQGFPPIRMQGIDRADSSSTTFRGKVLLVNVWATWCPPCRREMPSLEQLHSRLDPARAAVIGLSVEDDTHQVREWLKRSKITFPNYLDTHAPSAREILGISSYPQTFLVAPDGKVIARIEGARDWAEPKWIALVDKVYADSANVQR
ncbi:MAG: TlpA family protein disulfide reductase [Betaproteobacteria bacterium]|nr:TlpA family protein disulfide reductase [Betaproteobacteria bacterium]